MIVLSDFEVGDDTGDVPGEFRLNSAVETTLSAWRKAHDLGARPGETLDGRQR
jgi:hypothetical protein